MVFSQRLNDDLEAVALEGSHASVIGGAPAAAVVFPAGEPRTAGDPRIVELDERIEASEGAERQRLRAERAAAWSEVHAQRLGELAASSTPPIPWSARCGWGRSAASSSLLRCGRS